MLERISDVAAFVFANGEAAEEIVFGEENIGVLTPDENDARIRARDHALDTIEAILTASREVFVAEMKRNKCKRNLKHGWVKGATMRKNRAVGVPLVPGQATACVAIQPWGEPTMKVYLWVSTDPRHVPVAELAVSNAKLDFAIWRNAASNHIVTLPPPVEGEAVSDIAKRVGVTLARLAGPIAEAVLANKGAS